VLKSMPGNLGSFLRKTGTDYFFTFRFWFMGNIMRSLPGARYDQAQLLQFSEQV
jgi:hypothetical protein